MVFSREPSLSAPGHFNQLWKPSLDGLRINIPQSLSPRPPRDGESDGRAADGVSQNTPPPPPKFDAGGESTTQTDPLLLIRYELIGYRGLEVKSFHILFGPLWPSIDQSSD